ncbi:MULTISPECIES: hypothetical protein [Acinetobacter]|uniref:hypothetical protein n=1 Tax=Acinetobacter TaxID=469 RepID=UPI001CE3CD05|nr:MULTISPECIES: hypothetical protein [Acinetobacter]MCH7317635.1 hypothetical protein [Acinetobacter higginsii]MCI3881147.1 hypothetical protein [Acinetobacter higginsii]
MIIAWMRKFFKINLLFVFVLSILSCTGERGKSEMMSFEDIISKYFESYDPIFESSIKRPGNHAGTILIDKTKLSNVEMDGIKNKIKSDGWVEMENSENYTLYCLGNYQLIGILYPNDLIERNKKGEEITYEDINSWNIGLYYNKNGVNSCER